MLIYFEIYCVCVYEHILCRGKWKAEEGGQQTPKGKVTCGCEQPYMGAGNKIHICSKRSSDLNL